MNDHVEEVTGEVGGLEGLYRHWGAALTISVGCGGLLALFVGDKAPVPVPGVANPLFWIGWGPLAAIGIVMFLAVVAPERERFRWYGGATAIAVIAGLSSGLVAWERTDDVAFLIALHVPFVAWATVAASVSLGRTDPAGHFYAFIVQSMEVLVTGGIYLGAGGIFAALTVGIFSVLGVEPPESVLRDVAAFGIGVIPVLAVASVYDPKVAPGEQRPTGLARILRIMTWLMLPVALIMLALYVFWFIPAYFWRAFEEREVLIVYNATIIAILALLAAAVSSGGGHRRRQGERVLRYAVRSLGTLTLLLNAYALAAIVGRIVQYGGLTPNRHAVLGWNTVTLLMFAFLLVRSWSAAPDEWLPEIRTALARSMALAVGWTAWVVWGLPLLS